MPQPLRPADAPITEDDAVIAAALESASIPTLMMSLVHVTGDVQWLRGSIRPQRAIMGQAQGGLSAEERAEVRARALEVLAAYRDAGCRLPPPPDAATIREMMSFMVGEPIPEEYVPMMLEEMALDGQDARDVRWEGAEPRLRVLVIGAGMSGLLTAIRLEEAGVPYVIVEKNAGLGGTWYENTYPGCRVDIANHFYCYSFEPNHDWSEFYSQQPELRDYFERCARKYEVYEKIRFETEVVSARFDEESARWNVRMRSASAHGEAEAEEEFHAVVSAVGQLNRPRIPDLPGLDEFAGAAFHSAQWDHSVSLEGKRVAVVGTGASALQLVPEVAKRAEQLFVLQRSPAWMSPNPSYHRKVSDAAKWLFKHVPYYARWYRFLIFWPGSDGLLPSLVVDPQWPHPERSVNALNERTREAFVEYMRAQLGDDTALLEKVVPTYPPFGKRMLQDNGSWLSTLKQEHVELVDEGVAALTKDSIVTESGRHIDVDVVVFATGFHANQFLWPIRVVGRGGVELGELWGDDPRAYLGIAVPGFPNLFCLYGPGTNLAHAGSIIFHSECQVRYIMGCLKTLNDSGADTFECKQEVCDAFNDKLDQTHAGLVWSHPGMRSWYKNSAGRVTTTSPWRLVDYWKWTREPDLSDYLLR